MKKGLVAFLAFVLSACGGGAGGSSAGITSSPPPPPVQFSSFSDLPANTEVTVSGESIERTVTLGSDGRVTAFGQQGTIGSASANFVVNSQDQLTSIEVNGRNSSVEFDSSDESDPLVVPGTQIVVAALLGNADGSDQLIIADPFALGFDYQTFGAWGTGLLPGQTADYGLISVGAKTAGASVPTSGTATFSGVAGGLYVSNSGRVARYGAQATFGVNFNARTIDLSTFNDFLVDIETETATLIGLSLEGTLTYGAGSSEFDGTLTFGNSSGQASGRFYGPGAEELGGVFEIFGSSGSLLGGFGGRR